MNTTIAQRNALLARKLVIIACIMGCFGLALVPFYRQICEATGISQSRIVAQTASGDVDMARNVTVEFVASNSNGLNWTFEALDKMVQVHPGQQTVVHYRVVNNTGRRIVAQAVPSYAPTEAAPFFKKLQCFCFDQQTFAPGEARDMDVIFVVEPGLPADIQRLSLSYTFFDVTAEAGQNK
jgi:cytochrome c oxidase assembly protein subunit 11